MPSLSPTTFVQRTITIHCHREIALSYGKKKPYTVSARCKSLEVLGDLAGEPEQEAGGNLGRLNSQIICLPLSGNAPAQQRLQRTLWCFPQCAVQHTLIYDM